jgi:hypothetical protein
MSAGPATAEPPREEPESINAWLKRLAAEAPPPSEESVQLVQSLFLSPEHHIRKTA